MKKFISVLLGALLLVSCSTEFEEQSSVLAEKLHAESCEAVSVDSSLEITLEGVDTDYFGHPDWMLNSYAAQEFYYQAGPLLTGYTELRIKIQNDAGNAAFRNYTIRELQIVDSLYLVAEGIVSDVGTGLAGMATYQPLFDTVMPAAAFPQIDQTIAESEAKNGAQQSVSYGGYRRVILEYMQTPVVQIVVQQRRSAKTDCYLFSFSELTGLIMSLQLNGPLD